MMCRHLPYWKLRSLSNCWPLVMQPTNLSGVPFGNERLVRVFLTQQDRRLTILDQKETQACFVFYSSINCKASLISSLHHPYAHFSAWSLTPAWSMFILLPRLVCAWWYINWKSYQISNFKRSFCHLPPLKIWGWNSQLRLEFQMNELPVSGYPCLRKELWDRQGANIASR